MSKQKSSSKKGAVKPEALVEKAASEATRPVAKAVNESKSADVKVDIKAPGKTEVKTEVTPEIKPTVAQPSQAIKPKETLKTPRWFPVFGVFNLLLIIGIVAAGGYYWQKQELAKQLNSETMAALQKQLGDKVGISQLQQRLLPLESGVDNAQSQLADLKLQQQALQASAEKLYELYGRDESGWQLAEVEYLMRISQHKLILENDFEGAAITLQAASDKIAATADPGLLPVRVQISDEIAILKTRARPDLVGMTLLISQLGRQLKALKPGYQPNTDTSHKANEAQDIVAGDQTITDRVVSFLSSQVSIKIEDSLPTQTEALVVDIEQTLEDNLKLTRWTVLERDNFQFQSLMKENLRLFKQFYNLDNAANHDFYSQLQGLLKATVKPEKPDISGSLYLLKQIISKRENAPQESDNEESENG